MTIHLRYCEQSKMEYVLHNKETILKPTKKINNINFLCKTTVIFCFLFVGSITSLFAQSPKSLFDQSEFDCTYYASTRNGKVVTPSIFVDVPDSIMIAAAASNVLGKRIYFAFRVKKNIDKKNGYISRGPIQVDSKLLFYLADGTIITLKRHNPGNNGPESDMDAFSKYTKDKTYTEFGINCTVSEVDFEKLSKSELIKFEILWSERLQVYPVADGKIFMNQVPCILKPKNK